MIISYTNDKDLRGGSFQLEFLFCVHIKEKPIFQSG